MTQTRASLRELQKLDQEIARLEAEIESFEPRIEQVEEPAARLGAEVEALRKRLQESRVEERRLQLAAEEKQARTSKLQERLNQVRNLREEAAVHAELEMVRRALETDEHEVYTLMDQIRRMEERLAELEAEYAAAEEEVEPRRRELQEAREAALRRAEELRGEREAFAEGVDARERALYERIRRGGRTVVVAPMTEDGACGSCYSMIPLQVQHEIRTSDVLVLCEGCGVIVTPPDPEAQAA
ncbi:MAG: hypothetical protein D6701_14710, partial [Gemmatimonadetes bacterium]